MYFELDGTFPHHEANPIEPANLVDLQERVRRRGGRHRPGLRRRRRPLLPRRRAGPRGVALDADRAHRLPRAGQGARAPRSSTTSSPAAAVPEMVDRARRRPGPHPRRPLLHQGDDGRDRRDLRRRAQRALLLPRLLARRLRDAGRPARAGRAGRDRGGRSRRLLADYERYVVSGEINSTVADQAAVAAGIEAAYAGRDGVTHRPPRRAHRQPRRLVVQRPPLQHRAAAAPQRRGPGPRHHGARSATRSSPPSGVHA